MTAAHLVRMSLRMSPDRVIVGEVRGDEVIPMLNAMSQGNDGSMCTIHADSSAGVFRKLALYAIQSPERLPMEATHLLAASAIDLDRLPRPATQPAVRRVGPAGHRVRRRAGDDQRAVPTQRRRRRRSTRPRSRSISWRSSRPPGFEPDLWPAGVGRLAMTLLAALSGAGVVVGLCLVVAGCDPAPS